ncbi:MAG: hypothetical protein GKR89_24350 [Candidatus Latescibacteria bacterium]|nr:hypothetical protein [Candidatus Latescibacterota bacterium]
MTTFPASSADWDFDLPMTDEQKFIFDLKGWLLIPGVLSDDEIAPIKEHVVGLKKEYPDDHYMPGRWEWPSQALFDHPAVVGVLRQIIAADRSDSCYGFRCESSVPRVRSTDFEGLDPHGGPGVGPLAYNCGHGRIYSGLTRVVWELNPVEEGDGGTLLMSGSHKSDFPIHPAHRTMDSPVFDTYSCPAGSVLFFTESLCHAGPLWTNPNRQRISIFNCYAPDMAQYHKTNLPAEVIAAMPPKRQTLFRGVWSADFSGGRSNNYFADDNKAH